MKLSKPIKTLIAIVASVASVFYIGVWFMRTFSTDVEVEHTGFATIEHKLDAQGYILRCENVLISPTQGIVYYVAGNGEKVQKNATVANIYQSESLADTQLKILEIERKIKVLEDSAIDKNNIILDIGKIDQKIYESLVAIKSNTLSRNLSSATQNGDELLTILNKRQIISKQSDNFNSQIEQLENEKTNLSHSLNGLKTSISTKQSGYFSTSVDGYEEIFSIENLENMSVDSFQEMCDASPDDNLKNNNAGKIITDFQWYILCPIDKSLCTDMYENETYQLVFPHSSNLRIDFRLEKKITQTDRQTAVLVFKTLCEPEAFDFTRLQDVQIIKNVYSGLRIPKSSLRMLDGYEGVYTLKGSEVVFKRVERIFENEGYYIVNIHSDQNASEDQKDDSTYNYLSLYDSVITKGKDLFDGKVVK